MTEIRVITYKRPRLLERALRSVISQTCADWRVVVYDDSRGFESSEVVSALGDKRIQARQNAQNLGMVCNLSQAFACEPVFTDSSYACILEDDNSFDPHWLEANLAAMSAHSCRVMCRNYRVVDVTQGGGLVATDVEPMRELYGSKARYIDYLERVREAFFSFTIGTSCFFWDITSMVDLSFPEERFNGPVMEAGRSVCFPDPCWYEPEVLSSFSRFLDKSQTPRSEDAASTRFRRISKVSEIEFTRRLVRTWTIECHRPMSEILVQAGLRVNGEMALLRLAEAGYLTAFRSLRSRKAQIAAIKSWFVAALYRRAWQRESAIRQE